jgi:signal transduction histidine kinase/ActR/RegA family two-component response regulator
MTAKTLVDRSDTEALRARLEDAEEMLRAIRQGEIDALVVEGSRGKQVYTLHSADEPYRNLVEQMQEGAVVLSRSGDILYCNARFAELVDEPIETVMASRFDRFVNAPDLGAFEATLRAGSGRVRSRLVRVATGAFEVSLSLTTTSSPGGDRLNLIVSDLSELLEAASNRARAERDSRTKDEFLTMLAHELRNPLGAITNAVQVVELTHAQGERAIRAHEVIGRQVGHISHLINDMLDVERVVSGKIRLNREPLDLAEIVRQVVATFVANPGLNRTIDIAAETVWVDGDPQRLQQVLTNVITNAVKYTPNGGHIAVKLRPHGGDAVLTVEDSGFGISARLMPFIFDLYVQADRTLDRAQGGLGIGLTLVRRLVELHGGTIVASSEGEGYGSRFTLRLKEIPAAVAFVGVSNLRERRAMPRRVLLVEDNNDTREMMRMMLELAGHSVYDAPDGIRGLELLSVARPDVAIIDIGLPRMDGYQVAKRIRDDPHGRGMLLLALTGYSSSGDIRRSSEHGFDYHLIKPVDPDRLARLLEGGGEITQLS